MNTFVTVCDNTCTRSRYFI